ncbi:hypothetical protein C8F04DRAFT_1191267 [Mycena alexandri]|uniref:Uncharacterized protein n=1 Tax=Mycena alexandri TaxID=1745969 RepID=A0AAD6WYF3_9AGAR|nr:hypothetical protein C8F04DRAFT_1191267 [Mycena alexandri]
MGAGGRLGLGLLRAARGGNGGQVAAGLTAAGTERGQGGQKANGNAGTRGEECGEDKPTEKSIPTRNIKAPAERKNVKLTLKARKERRHKSPPVPTGPRNAVIGVYPG